MAGPDDIDKIAQSSKEMQDQFANATGTATDFFDKIINGAAKAGLSLKEIKDTFRTVDDLVKQASSDLTVFGAMNNNISALQDPLDKLTASFIKFSSLVDQSVVFKQFDVQNSPAINTVNLNLDKLQKTMNALHIPGADQIINATKSLVANANEAEKLENNFVALSSAAGDLDKVWDSQTGQLKDLAALTTAYTITVGNAADATGMNLHETMDFANSLKLIPGIMDQNITTTNKGEESTTSLIAAMRLMTGTGRSQKEVTDLMTEAYNKLGQSQGKVNDSAQKGAEFIATISSVSSDLKLRFEDVRSVLEATADEFKFVGDNTEGAAKVLGRYTDALRETGLTSKASTELIGQMTANIGKMEMGTKAFLSLRSGGPGGLQGAFQIEQLLRQGNLDQVVQMAEKSLKQQMGGRIYTQAEAASNPGAASQFMRQRQLLQSGAFGVGKGMGDEQATRLLEAMGKGDTLAATKELKTGQNAVTEVTKRGADVQQRNNTELKTLNRTSEKIALSSQLSALAMVRNSFGTTAGSPVGEGLVDRMKLAGTNKANMLQNNTRALETGGALDKDSADRQFAILRRQFMSDLTESGKGTANGIVDFAKTQIGGTVSTGIKAVREIAGTGSKTQTADHMKKTMTKQSSDKAPQWLHDYMGDHAGDQKKKQDVLAKASITPHSQTLPKIAPEQTAKQKNANKKTEPQKIVLEIVAPAGYTAKKVGSNNSIQKHNQQSTVVNLDLDEPGY